MELSTVIEEALTYNLSYFKKDNLHEFHFNPYHLVEEMRAYYKNNGNISKIEHLVNESINDKYSYDIHQEKEYKRRRDASVYTGVAVLSLEIAIAGILHPPLLTYSPYSIFITLSATVLVQNTRYLDRQLKNNTNQAIKLLQSNPEPDLWKDTLDKNKEAYSNILKNSLGQIFY